MKSILLFGAGLLLSLTSNAAEFVAPIHWKIGDHLEYDISIAGAFKIGTATSDVVKEEGDAVWLVRSTHLSSKEDRQELLVNRQDGKILKYLKNGQESTYTEDPMQITSQDEESVSVPAGQFQSLHAKGTSSSGSPIETWTNTEATAIDGVIKTVLSGGTSIELTHFTRVP